MFQKFTRIVSQQFDEQIDTNLPHAQIVANDVHSGFRNINRRMGSSKHSFEDRYLKDYEHEKHFRQICWLTGVKNEVILHLFPVIFKQF